MKRSFTFTLVVGLLLGVMTTSAVAYENNYSRWARRECIFHRNGDWNLSENRDVIRCAAKKLSPGHGSVAMYIADRESGYYEKANNPHSTAFGLFQWLRSSWPKSRFDGLVNQWNLIGGRGNPRTAAFISVAVMRSGGCDPWFMSC